MRNIKVFKKMREGYKAACVYCGKEVFSWYKNQLLYNINAHEKTCPMRERKKEVINTNGISSGVEKVKGK